MRVIDVRPVEDCVDRVVVKEIVFSRPVTSNWIQTLENLGKLDYYHHFPKPFYRLTRKGDYIIKGVEAQDRCRVTFINYTAETEAGLLERLNRLETD